MIASPTLTHKELKESFLNEVERSSESVLMQDILNKVIRVAHIDTHVLIVGEIGSGKKRIAKVIHKNSIRSDGPFYSFYCVDINEKEYKEAFWEHLHFDEEHITLKYDAIEKASGGILYLDQFSELSAQFMLNIINSFVKSSDQLFRYDISSRPRLIISMNQESYQNVSHTAEWATILNKIDPVELMLPPLRERREDIPIIIASFIREINTKNSKWSNLNISDEALEECCKYHWPGNIRQLKNAILQGAILSHGETIKSCHLPFSMSWKLPYDVDGNRKSN